MMHDNYATKAQRQDLAIGEWAADALNVPGPLRTATELELALRWGFVPVSDRVLSRARYARLYGAD